MASTVSGSACTAAPRPFRTACLAVAALAASLSASMADAAADMPPATTAAPLQPVTFVDLSRYMGRWYQIAFYPNEFQEQCVGDVTADYRLLPYGQVEVVNQCRQADGVTDKAVGRARLQQPRLLGIPVDKPYSTARLEVRFAPSLLSWLPQVWAPYWVIQLADDYRYAVVSEPTRRYLWVLSRKPTLDVNDEASIVKTLRGQGFDTGKLVKQPQSAP